MLTALPDRDHYTQPPSGKRREGREHESREQQTLLRSNRIYLFGLSLRLVLRALKLSFSGVSSKDRSTLERRPCRGDKR